MVWFFALHLQYQNNQNQIIMKSNWKMYGIWIGGVTIIPCYYDLLRYFRNLKRFKHKFNIFQLTNLWYRFECLFDTTKKPI